MKRRWSTLILALAVLVSALAIVHTRHESRRTFVRLQAFGADRDELNVEWGRLQLEQATWAEAGRIEQQARSELGLVAKEPERVVVVVNEPR